MGIGSNKNVAFFFFKSEKVKKRSEITKGKKKRLQIHRCGAKRKRKKRMELILGCTLIQPSFILFLYSGSCCKGVRVLIQKVSVKAVLQKSIPKRRDSSRLPARSLPICTLVS